MKKVAFEFELGESDERLIAQVLDCVVKPDDGENRIDEKNLEMKMNLVAKAAFEEYLRMMLGQKVFTRGKDMLEYRMFLLIRELFGSQIPMEEQISAVFQTTSTESRGLIRSVMSKYQYELKQAIEHTIKFILEEVVIANGKYKVRIHNEGLKDEMNRILSMSKEKDLLMISKYPKTVTTYIIPESSYKHLCERYGVKSKKLEE